MAKQIKYVDAIQMASTGKLDEAHFDALSKHASIIPPFLERYYAHYPGNHRNPYVRKNWSDVPAQYKA